MDLLNYAENELATLENMPMSPYTQDEKQWGDLVESSSFLPRVQLYGGTSNACKEGKIPIGHFGIIKTKDEIDADLGVSFDCLPLSWRFKAMDVSNKEAIISVYNPKAEEFKRIVTQSEVKDSGCMYGIEFLVWIPAIAGYATYYLNNASSRREAPNLKALTQPSPRPATVKSKFIKGPKHSWHGPAIVACSTPMDTPDPAEAMEHAQRFANPKESQIEKVEPVSGGRVQ